MHSNTNSVDIIKLNFIGDLFTSMYAMACVIVIEFIIEMFIFKYLKQ